MMKKNVFSFCLSLILFSVQPSFAQVGINTTTPRGALEVSSNNSGVLFPSVALTAANVSAPVVNPQTGGAPVEGTIVYNTATVGSGNNILSPGLYMWDGSYWQRFNASPLTQIIEDDLRTSFDRATGSSALVLDFAPFATTSKIWYFPLGNNMSEVFFSVQLPHNWVEGTSVFPHVHWTPKADSGGVKTITWYLDYQWVNVQEAGSNPPIIPAQKTLSGVETRNFLKGQHIMTYIGGDGPGLGIDGTGKNFSSVIICRLYRKPKTPGDDLDVDAGGLSVDFHINVYR